MFQAFLRWQSEVVSQHLDNFTANRKPQLRWKVLSNSCISLVSKTMKSVCTTMKGYVSVTVLNELLIRHTYQRGYRFKVLHEAKLVKCN